MILVFVMNNEPLESHYEKSRSWSLRNLDRPSTSFAVIHYAAVLMGKHRMVRASQIPNKSDTASTFVMRGASQKVVALGSFALASCL